MIIEYSMVIIFQFSACLQQIVGEVTLNDVQAELNQVIWIEIETMLYPQFLSIG